MIYLLAYMLIGSIYLSATFILDSNAPPPFRNDSATLSILLALAFSVLWAPILLVVLFMILWSAL